MVTKIVYEIIEVIEDRKEVFKIRRIEYHELLWYFKWKESSYLKFPYCDCYNKESFASIELARSVLELINKIINFCGSYGNPYYAGLYTRDLVNFRVCYYRGKEREDGKMLWSRVADEEKIFKKIIGKEKVHDSITWKKENIV